MPGVAEAVTGELDPQAILDRRDEVIHDLDDSGQLPWLEERGIELFRGEGRLDGERRVVVGDETLTRPARPSWSPPAAARRCRRSTGSTRSGPGTTARRRPPSRSRESMIVLGGGPVGSELAQAWSSLGTQVTLVEGDERLLAARGALRRRAGRRGAARRLRRRRPHRRGHRCPRRVGGEPAAVSRSSSTTAARLEAAELLVAVGRRPRTDGIGLDSVGVEPGKGGFLETDDRLRVGGRDWLYAVGDVNGRALFTHMGKYQAWVAAENVLGRESRRIAEGIGSPRVTFTDPQVAAVGKTLEQARRGRDRRRARSTSPPTAPPAPASRARDTGGTSRLVVDQTSQTIVGATFTGFETADFLHAATVAIVGEVPLPRLRHAVAAYPTAARSGSSSWRSWEAAS